MTLICRHWRPITVPLLYRDIVLRRVGEVFAFAETLHSQTTDYGAFVRSLTLMCYVPQNLQTLYRTAVQDILSSCTNLSELTFGRTFPDVTTPRPYRARTLTAYDFILCQSIRDVILRLSTFKIHDELNPILRAGRNVFYPFGFMKRLKNIVSLDFPLYPQGDSKSLTLNTNWLREFRGLELPSLKEITFRHDDIAGDFDVLSTWVLPCLKRVNLVDHWCCTLSSHDDLPLRPQQLTQFFLSHSNTISELCMTRLWGSSNHGTLRTEVQKILTQTPLLDALTYLVLPLAWIVSDEIFYALPIDERADTLQVDLWSDDWAEDEVLHYLVDLESGASKYRPNVRILDYELEHITSLPAIFPPAMRGGITPDRLPIVHDIFGLHIVQTPFAVYRLESESCNLWTSDVEKNEFMRFRPEDVTLKRWFPSSKGEVLELGGPREHASTVQKSGTESTSEAREEGNWDNRREERQDDRPEEDAEKDGNDAKGKESEFWFEDTGSDGSSYMEEQESDGSSEFWPREAFHDTEDSSLTLSEAAERFRSTLRDSSNVGHM